MLAADIIPQLMERTRALLHYTFIYPIPLYLLSARDVGVRQQPLAGSVPITPSLHLQSSTANNYNELQ